jgi:hypothetical protein
MNPTDPDYVLHELLARSQSNTLLGFRLVEQINEFPCRRPKN